MPHRRQTGVNPLRSRAGRPTAIPPGTTYWNAQLKPDENHPLTKAAATALRSVDHWDAS